MKDTVEGLHFLKFPAAPIYTPPFRPKCSNRHRFPEGGNGL